MVYPKRCAGPKMTACRLMQASVSRYLRPPSPSLATGILPSRGYDHGRVGFLMVNN